MVMVSANNLKMEFGNIEIFGNVTFDIYDNDIPCYSNSFVIEIIYSGK